MPTTCREPILNRHRKAKLDDDALLVTISSDDFVEQQRADPELKCLAEYLEGMTDFVPRVFRRGLPLFSLPNDVLVKENFTPARANYLLVGPAAIHSEVFHALLDDQTAAHLGF